MENKLAVIDGETLMALRLEPTKFCVRTLLPQGVTILGGAPTADGWWRFSTAVTQVTERTQKTVCANPASSAFLAALERCTAVCPPFRKRAGQTVCHCQESLHGPNLGLCDERHASRGVISSACGGQAERPSDVVGPGTSHWAEAQTHFL